MAKAAPARTPSTAEEVASGLSFRKKFLFSVLVTLGFFATLEVGIRVGAYFMYHRSPYFLFYGIKSRMADDNAEGHTVGRAGYFKFPPNRLLHQYGMFTRPTPIRINSLGFRGPDFNAFKPPGVFRVVCLGESSTFGFFNRDGYTYPALLERLFMDQLDRTRGTVEVINAGIPHANSDNILAMLRGEVLGYHPDVVTIYAGYNDAAYMMDENMLQRALRWTHEHFATYVALKRLVSALGGPEMHSRWAEHFSSPGRDYVRRQIDLHVVRYERNMRAIVSLAQRDGVRVIFIKQPMIIDYHKGSDDLKKSYGERIHEAQEALAQSGGLSGARTTLVVHAALMGVLDRLACEYHIRVVDNIAIVDKHPEYYASYVHLTEDGNRALAEALLETATQRR